MELNPSLRLSSGLYVFNVVVRVILDEPEQGWTSEGEELDPMIGYYQPYVVTAASTAAAASIIERLLAEHEPDPDEPQGSVDDIEFALIPAEAVADKMPEGAWRTTAGCWLEAGRVMFADDEHEAFDPLED